MKSGALANQFFHLKQIQPCLKKFSSLFSWSPLSALVHVLTQPISSLRKFFNSDAIQNRAIGLAAFREHALNNTRNLVGNILLLAGLVTIFIHQIFSHLPSPSELDRTWYYLHDYYLLVMLRFPLMFILWSAAFLLLIPPKFKYAIVPFSLAHSYGWMLFVQRAFLLNIHGLDITDKPAWQAINIQYNSLPSWEIVVMALCLGTSILLTLDYMLYRQNHIRRGNNARFVGIAEMKGFTPEQKEPMYKQLAEEFRNQNARI